MGEQNILKIEIRFSTPNPFGHVVFGSCWLLGAVLKMGATGAGSTPGFIPDLGSVRSIFSRSKLGVGGWVQTIWSKSGNFKTLIIVTGPLLIQSKQ